MILTPAFVRILPLQPGEHAAVPAAAALLRHRYHHAVGQIKHQQVLFQKNMTSCCCFRLQIAV
jgi:hypothetical protein